jgi:NlpC/P60 family putative phage cell wall peptidase
LDNERERVVAEARKWLGTPYHHRGRVLGHGCDCAQLVAASFAAAGLIEYVEPKVYSKDWHLHRGEEKYIAEVERYFRRVGDDDRPVAKRPEGASYQPGDVLMFRLGRTFSHSAIITRWPFIIHASAPAIMVEEVDIRGTPMELLPTRVYSYWRDQ